MSALLCQLWHAHSFPYTPTRPQLITVVFKRECDYCISKPALTKLHINIKTIMTCRYKITTEHETSYHLKMTTAIQYKTVQYIPLLVCR